MEVFTLTKKFWIFFGFYSDENTSSTRIFCGKLGNLMLSMCLLIFFLSVAMLFTTDKLHSIEDAFHSIFEMVIVAIAMPTYIALLLQKKRFIELVIDFQSIVNNRLSPERKFIYEMAERKCEIFTKWPLILGVVTYTIGFPSIIFITWTYQRRFGIVNTSEWFNVFVMW